MTHSKTIRAAAAALCLFAASAAAQTQPNSRAGENLAATADSDLGENSAIAQTPIDETTITLGGGPALETEPPAQPSTLWLLVRMILMLAVVIACVYAVVYLMRRSTRRGLNFSDDFLRVVSRVDLAPDKSVQVVSLLDEKAFIIGVSDGAVNLIGEITDKDTINAMNLNADRNQGARRQRAFGDLLSIFMPNQSRDKNIFEGSGEKAQDALRKQHGRLGGTED